MKALLSTLILRTGVSGNRNHVKSSPFPCLFLSLITHYLYSINSFALGWQKMEKKTESRFAHFLEFKGASLGVQTIICLQ